MARQEVDHAILLSNMLGSAAPQRCNYTYPFTTVREYIDFSQKLTRWGEAGVYGFLEHMDSRESATLLLQSITTEARQQMIFRQFEGLFAMPEFFEVGTPQVRTALSYESVHPLLPTNSSCHSPGNGRCWRLSSRAAQGTRHACRGRTSRPCTCSTTRTRPGSTRL